MCGGGGGGGKHTEKISKNNSKQIATRCDKDSPKFQEGGEAAVPERVPSTSPPFISERESVTRAASPVGAKEVSRPMKC